MLTQFVRIDSAVGAERNVFLRFSCRNLALMLVTLRVQRSNADNSG